MISLNRLSQFPYIQMGTALVLFVFPWFYAITVILGGKQELLVKSVGENTCFPWSQRLYAGYVWSVFILQLRLKS